MGHSTEVIYRGSNQESKSQDEKTFIYVESDLVYLPDYENYTTIFCSVRNYYYETEWAVHCWLAC